MRRPFGLSPIAILAGSVFAPGLAVADVDTTRFSDTAFAQPAEIVDCTLEDGAASRCARIVVDYLPEGLEIGPFCPATLDDVGGIWDWTGQNPGLYRVNERFLRMLDALGYTFYDADGTVHIAGLDATRLPVHDHACVNMSLDETVEITVLLPLSPVMAQRTRPLGVVSKVGLALDGVPIFSDAPSIQRTGHMPALDTCGGHVDPGGWYHWHATSTDIETVFGHEHAEADCGLPQDASALFGYAFDGFPIYGSADMDGGVPNDLDACNGHIGPTREDPEGSYHYHSSIDFPNLPPCLVGLQARDNFVTTAQVGIGANPPEGTVITRRDPPGGGPRDGPPPGFAEAARTLGVSEAALMRAVRDAGGPQLDFAAAAAILGVSEEALRAALPPPPPPPR